MLRLIVYFLVGYFVWRIIRAALRLARPPRQGGDPGASGAAPPPGEKFTNVEDAQFEDISPKEEKDGHNAPPAS